MRNSESQVEGRHPKTGWAAVPGKSVVKCRNVSRANAAHQEMIATNKMLDKSDRIGYNLG